MKNINIDDIKVSSKLDDIIKNSVDEGFEKSSNKNKNMLNRRNGKSRKSIVAAAIIVAVGATVFGSIFRNEVIAAVKLTMFDIKNYLGVNKDLDEYKTVVNEAISKNGITIQLNEVILDKDEVIVSTTIKSDKKLDKDIGLMAFGSVYINGKEASGASSGGSKQIDEYTQEMVLSYGLNNELKSGDLYIEIKYDEVTLLIDSKENNIKGPWSFEFTSNGDALSISTNNIELNNSFTLDNGQKVTLNKYRSNSIGQKIYYSVENRDITNPYDLLLRGHDDLGNKVEFYISHEEDTSGLMKNQTEISDDAKILTLAPYAVALPKGGGKMSNDHKQVGEEFTIQIK